MKRCLDVAVEINYMQSRRTLLCKTPRHRERIAVHHRWLIGASAIVRDTLAVLYIQARNDEHKPLITIPTH